MEAGTILNSAIPLNPKLQPQRTLSRRFSNYSCFIRASSNSQVPNTTTPLFGGYKGPKPKRDRVADWVSNNDDTVRSLPIYVGATSLLAVLVNRAVSGIAPVADASR